VTIMAPVGRDYPAQIATGALAVLFRVSDASMTEIAFLLLTGGSDCGHERHGRHGASPHLNDGSGHLLPLSLSPPQVQPVACGWTRSRLPEDKREQTRTMDDKLFVSCLLL